MTTVFHKRMRSDQRRIFGWSRLSAWSYTLLLVVISTPHPAPRPCASPDPRLWGGCRYRWATTRAGCSAERKLPGVAALGFAWALQLASILTRSALPTPKVVRYQTTCSSTGVGKAGAKAYAGSRSCPNRDLPSLRMSSNAIVIALNAVAGRSEKREGN